ncbi:hypothetical protein ACNPKZ_00645 [Shewanella algae]|uniref:hypothetical protein n=1 Tax=Shewanella algae TaxID=38313 RepID=UPI003AB036EE
MLIKKYSDECKVVWDEFVSLSKTQHFFFFREYLNYHKSRFEDHSLMFYDEKGTLLALLPANRDGNLLISHQGLTFGGLLIKPSTKQVDVIKIFQSILDYMEHNSIGRFLYKKCPQIYCSMPNDEDLYALFKLRASLVRRDVSSAIKVGNQIKYSKGRKWIIKKSKSFNLVYNETEDLNQFWSRLSEVLEKYHGAKPVHSLEEIDFLQKKFPNNIKFYSAQVENECLAGAVIFDTGITVHTQYLFNTDQGREFGALDGLLDYLVKSRYKDKEYFDFGTSNEQQGRYLNEGLIGQKEGFGARAIVHDFYELKLND